MNFKNYILKPEIQNQLKECFEKIKETLLEIKSGYKYGLKLVNKKTNESWLSSTDDLKGRENSLKSTLKRRNEWYGPWLDTFGDLNEDEILDQIEFVPYGNVNDILIEDILNQPVSVPTALKTKNLFLEIFRSYLKDQKTNNDQINAYRKMIDDFFDTNNKYLRLINLVDIIDSKEKESK